MLYAYKASASAAFAIGRLVHISGLCSPTFNAVKGKARRRATYRRVTLIHHILYSEFLGDVLHEGITH